MSAHVAASDPRASLAARIAPLAVDESACPLCLRENCEGDCTATSAPPPGTYGGLDPFALADAVDVARQGQEIARVGVPYVIEGIVPRLGMLGFLVAFAKVGKSTFSISMAGAVAHGQPFIGRDTDRCRVLIIAAEDPAEYTAYVARDLSVPAGAVTFYRGPLLLDTAGLNAIVTTVKAGRYGLVLIASWQAVIRGLVKDENDNAGGVVIVEAVKQAARQTGIPWLIDAHSGKSEDVSDEADPTKALRGASAAAGAADFLLLLRYADSPFSSRRRFSGKGRFVSFPAMTLDFDPQTSTYQCIGSPKDATRESTWQLIQTAGALDATPRSLTEIATLCGLLEDGGRLDGNRRRQLALALADRPDVGRQDGLRRSRKTTLYFRLAGAA